MKIKLLSYSDENYYHAQSKLESLALNENIDFISYKKNDLLITDFYKENREILDFSKGAGFCLWKPYFILNELKKMEYGDVLIYMDSSDIFKSGFKIFLINHFNNNDILLLNNFHINKIWTKRDTFYYMQCDEDKYWNSTQLEAGICGFKKTDFNIKLIEEWLFYCKNKHIVTDIENVCGYKNFDNFIDHRYDQSVLTNLSIKYNLSRNNFWEFVSCNVNK